jgi:hypothetical protein
MNIDSCDVLNNELKLFKLDIKYLKIDNFAVVLTFFKSIFCEWKFVSSRIFLLFTSCMELGDQNC